MSITYVNDDAFHPSNDDYERWSKDGWEMVVGLEVHVELATKTKLFSASPNRFGDERTEHRSKTDEQEECCAQKIEATFCRVQAM